MADILPDLVTLKGSKRVELRREPRSAGNFKYLTDAQIDPNDRDLLRFSNGIANMGPGPLEVGGDPSQEWRTRKGTRMMPAYQRIKQTDGTVRKIYVGPLVFDTDPDHRHWHYSGFAEYRLYDSTGLVRRSRKQAFCLIDFDQLRPGARADYPRCSSRRMGISPGWADTYTWELHGQEISIKNLRSGTYRLVSITNPSGRLKVRSQKGMRASIRLRIDKANDKVTILG